MRSILHATNGKSFVNWLLPVQNIESSVKAQKEYIMSRDILYISEFINHVELREDGQRLEPYAERPQKIHWIQRFVCNYSC